MILDMVSNDRTVWFTLRLVMLSNMNFNNGTESITLNFETHGLDEV